MRAEPIAGRGVEYCAGGAACLVAAEIDDVIVVRSCNFMELFRPTQRCPAKVTVEIGHLWTGTVHPVPQVRHGKKAFQEEQYCPILRVSKKQGSNRMPRRLLVVVTTDVQDATLRQHVRHLAGEDAELLVVAPASSISRLDWLTNAEDDARAEAGALADKTAEATPTTDVEAQVGDSDPVKAIEDALREFPADEVLVVTRPDDDASWLEEGSGEAARERFRLPVSVVTVAEDGSLTPR
jgi:hypothetical protein